MEASGTLIVDRRMANWFRWSSDISSIFSVSVAEAGVTGSLKSARGYTPGDRVISLLEVTGVKIFSEKIEG